jgi:hypothetical protein
MAQKVITRRDFIRAAALSPLAGALAHGMKRTKGMTSSGQSRVVLIRDEKALVSFKKPDPEVVQNMLDEAVTTLLAEKDPVEAWKRLVKSSDIVGIKTNVMHYLPTTPEVEQAIKKRILDVGVPEQNISIDDRGVRRNPVFQRATAIINARPARTHHWSGIGGCIKNHIMFVPRASAYHPDSCADLAALWKEFNLIERTRLNILVMLNPQFHTVGPHSYNDKYVWDYKGIMVSQDPVAVDAMGLMIIEAKRREYFGEDLPMQTPAKHIRMADTKHNLGVSDPSRIELIKLGWKEGILI